MNYKQIGLPSLKAVAALVADPLYRTSFFMAFSSIFNAGCGFFFWMIAARHYSVEQVGQATALISSLGLVLQVSRLGLDFSIIRFFPSGDKSKILSTSLIITTSASVFAGFAYILMIDLLAPSLVFLEEFHYLVAFLLIGMAYSVSAITGNAFVADRKAENFLFQNIFMALRIPLLIPLAFLGTYGIFGSMGLSFIAASLFALMILARSLNFIRLEIDADFLRRSFKFSSWNYLSNILSTAPTLLLPIMVLNMLGEAEAARYYIAFTMGNLVLIIPSSLGTSLFVEGSHGEGLKKSVIRAGFASLVLLLPAILLLFLFGEGLLGMLKQEYVQALDLLKIIAISSIPVTVYSLFIPIQNVRMQVEGVLRLNGLRFILIMGLSYLLIHQYGILGVGYAWIAAYGVIVIVIGWIAWKERWV